MAPLRFFTGIRGILALLFVVLLSACPQPQAQPQTEEREYKGFWYITTSGVIQIINYTGSKTDISIPLEIENLPVAEIGGRYRLIVSSPDGTMVKFFDGAFENKKLISVILPDTIRDIGVGAFANNNLTMIHLPDNITLLGSCAFMNNKLIGIVIPGNIWLIGEQAFEGNQISDVTIGSGVRHIGVAAFRNNKIASLIVPENVYGIDRYAFAFNEIVELNFADGLFVIATFAFEGNRLTRLSIPTNVRIYEGAFKDNDITRISVGENVKLYPGSETPVFELGFDEFYLENEEQAGEYVYENGVWEFLGNNQGGD